MVCHVICPSLLLSFHYYHHTLFHTISLFFFRAIHYFSHSFFFHPLSFSSFSPVFFFIHRYSCPTFWLLLLILLLLSIRHPWLSVFFIFHHSPFRPSSILSFFSLIFLQLPFFLQFSFIHIFTYYIFFFFFFILVHIIIFCPLIVVCSFLHFITPLIGYLSPSTGWIRQYYLHFHYIELALLRCHCFFIAFFFHIVQ